MFRSRIPWFLLVVLACAAARAGDLDPQVLAQRHARAFVAALNDTDRAARERALPTLYAEATLSGIGTERLLGQLERVHGMLGRLEFHGIETLEARGPEGVRRVMHLFAKAGKDGRWRDLQFMLEPVPPYRIAQMVFIAEVTEPVYLPNGAIDAEDTLAWLNGYIDRLAQREDLAAAILVRQGERTLLERYVGYADAARKRPIDAGTRFNLASGNKMFTAIGIAQLVAKEKLDYRDPISRFLPDFPEPERAGTTTLHHLLSHTSGIGEYWTDAFRAVRPNVRGTRDLLPWVVKAGYTAPAGTRYEYSNSNYALAGLVLEQVGGQDYDAFVRERIAAPLGLRDTACPPADAADPRRAQALVRGKDQPRWQAAPVAGRGTAAGGCVSTARDMARFAAALGQSEVVDARMLAEMTRPHTEGLPGTSEGEQYGYGFELARRGGVSSFGHGGITAGVNFELRRFPAPDLTLVMFGNQDNGAYDDLRRNTIKLITGER